MYNNLKNGFFPLRNITIKNPDRVAPSQRNQYTKHCICVQYEIT